MSSIEIKGHFEKVIKTLENLSGFAQNPHEFLSEIGGALVDSTKERFNVGKDPDGNPWKSLNPEYKSTKIGGPGILQGETHSLQDTISSRVDGDRLSIGSNLIYSNVHQFGALILPVKASALVFMMGGHLHKRKSVTIPARPYLGFSHEDREGVFDTLNVFFGNLLKD